MPPLSHSRSGAATFLLLAAIAGLSACRGGAEADPRRDVLLVTVDSLRADRPGFVGGPVKTPNMDRLAAEAVRFESAYTTAPQTLGSLASLLTGLYPSSHGARVDGKDRIREGVVTLASVLGRQGYATAAFPAAMVLGSKHGLAEGFDVYQEPFEEAPRHVAADTVGLPATQVADRALEWLESVDDARRFFLWVHFFDPHYFHNPSSPWKEQYPEEPYNGEIAQVDHELGRLLDGLREHGREGSTLVVLAGNHGEGLGDDGEQFYGLLLSEATLRVPLVIRRPQEGQGASVVEEPVSLVDVAPTLIDLLGMAAPEGLDGVSLRPLMSPSADSSPGPGRPLYFETLLPERLFGWAALRGVRSGSLKYVEAPGAGWRALFDLKEDPAASTDVSGERGSDVERLAGESQRMGGTLPSIRDALEGPVADRVASLGMNTTPRPSTPKLPGDNVDLGNAVLQARRSLERGMTRAASLLLREVLERDPTNYSGLMDAAIFAAMAQRLPDAERSLRQVQSLYPSDGEVYHQLGHLALLTRKGAEALASARRLFVTAAHLSPLNEEALYDAACSVADQDPDQALDYLDRAVRNGYRNFAHMAVDPDMNPIRETARFKLITRGLAVPPQAPPPAGSPASPGAPPAASPGG